MKRLFKHEFFKLFHSKAFWVVLIIVAGLAAFQATLIGVVTTVDGGAEAAIELDIYPGYGAVITSFSDFSNLSIFFAVILTFLVCNELRNRTMQNTLLADFTRGEVYFAKLLTSMLAATIIVAVQMIIYVSATVIAFGWGKDFTFASLWGDMLSILLLGLFLCYGLVAMLNFFAIWLKNPIFIFLIAIVLPLILLIIVVIGALGSGFCEFIGRFAYTNVLSNYFREFTRTNQFPLTHFAYCIVTIALLLVPFTVGGYFLFKKQEVK